MEKLRLATFVAWLPAKSRDLAELEPEDGCQEIELPSAGDREPYHFCYDLWDIHSKIATTGVEYSFTAVGLKAYYDRQPGYMEEESATAFIIALKSGLREAEIARVDSRSIFNAALRLVGPTAPNMCDLDAGLGRDLHVVAPQASISTTNTAK